MLTQSDLSRFWNKVSIGNTDECWEWTAGLDDGGYGQFKLGKKNIKAHRVSYIIHNSINPNQDILHSCDNTKCVNPGHLRTGSDVDNMKDMYNRDRAGHTLYSSKQVIQMRRLARSGASRQDLVNQFGGNRYAAFAAVSGKTYGWVDEPVTTVLARDRNRGSKLTVEQVIEIKKMFLKPYHGLNRKIEKQYDLSAAEVSHIKMGRLYADVSID